MKPRKQKAPSVRADQLLVSQGLAGSRERARALILAGVVFHGTQRVEKAGQPVREDTQLRVEQGPRYVSRGGEKLEGALQAFGLDVIGTVVLDVGSSTGGFTDCLLQHGAMKVYAVDAGTNQLAARLRADSRVVSMEQTNMRHGIELPEHVDLIVADVSFISLRLVLPPALRHLKPGGSALLLVKPQFEAGRQQVGKGGVIRDPQVHAGVVGGFCLWAIGQGLQPLGVRPSIIQGDAGNREFFVLLRAAFAASHASLHG
ncbi:MAG: TlyA family RNA methyltransferase [Dehalococcoidia bacterium]